MRHCKILPLPTMPRSPSGGAGQIDSMKQWASSSGNVSQSGVAYGRDGHRSPPMVPMPTEPRMRQGGAGGAADLPMENTESRRGAKAGIKRNRYPGHPCSHTHGPPPTRLDRAERPEMCPSIRRKGEKVGSTSRTGEPGNITNNMVNM